MVILIGFAFLAGIVTVAAPCILPVLPLILTGGASQGKRRPWGIILGVILSFSIFTLTLTWLVDQLGFSPNFARNAGITLLVVIGVVMLIPGWLEKFEGWISKMVQRQGAQKQRHGFGGGLVLGISLGAVWTPCAGPILASVTTAAATSEVNTSLVLITIAYAAGAALPMGLIAALGQRIIARVRWFNAHARQIQSAFGVLILIIAGLMVTNLDRKIQAAIVEATPGWLTNLQDFETKANIDEIMKEGTQTRTQTKSTDGALSDGATLPDYGIAPELTGITGWINGEPTSLADLRGKVVLVKFWTYSCINCIRTFPYVQSWYDTYHDQGFEIIAVHSPEFAFEAVPENVENAVQDYDITYPVALDPDFTTWRAYSNRYWPAKYFVDANGRIRHFHFGEGEYDESERVIQELLTEAGNAVQVGIREPAAVPIAQGQTPETYFGTDRQERFTSPESITTGTTQTFSQPESLNTHEWAVAGPWTFTDEFTEAGSGATMQFSVVAKNVYVVMEPNDGATPRVVPTVDGVEAPAITLGSSSSESSNLYRIAQFAEHGSHALSLSFPDGAVRLYAATFGSGEAEGITCSEDGICTVSPL